MNVVKKPLSPATGDFYHISAILSEEDQELLFRVRALIVGRAITGFSAFV